MTLPEGTLSHVRGTTEQPLLRQTVGETLQLTADHWPERDALIVCHQGVRLTYRQLNEQVSALARGLLALGLVPGDRVGIWSPNSVEWVLTQFATARAGLVLVSINPAYRPVELGYALRKVGCRALMLATATRTSDYPEMISSLLESSALSGEGRVASRQFPDLRWLIQAGGEAGPRYMPFDSLPGAALQTAAAAGETPRPLSPDEPINIQFTSGTTGLPKGATLSHNNIVNNGFFVGEGLRLVRQDRVCIPVPLYHCFGMVLGVLAAVTHGAAMIFPSASFDAEATLRAVEAERCTALHGVPTMFIAELEHPQFGQFDLSSLRTGIMAGAPCPISVMRRVLSEMYMREVTICYGMTETSPVSFQSDVSDPLERRVTTVGRVHPHVEVKIVDTIGHTVPRSTAGELCTRGYSVMNGYWNDAEQTAQVLDAEGWMHTGDLAMLDEEGYCNIVGRVKDLIIRGGENIYPREIEEYLYRHPKILDVAVVGVADEKYGEAVCAIIRLREGAEAQEQDIIDFCRGQIAHFKVPRYVRFLDAFPMTVTGKVRKVELRERMEKELGVARVSTA